MRIFKTVQKQKIKSTLPLIMGKNQVLQVGAVQFLKGKEIVVVTSTL